MRDVNEKEAIVESRPNIEKLLRPSELTEILGLKRSCIYRMLKSGAIPSIAVAGGDRKFSLRVRPSQLEKWLKERELR